MKTTNKKTWHELPPIVLPSPIYALATSEEGVWAGGMGGVAWYPFTNPEKQWQPRIATLPLSSVTALFYINGLLLAGGAEGIASSKDNGEHWQLARLEDGLASITAFAISPNFAKDGIALAATMTNGIVRSDDGGLNWVNASFGLESFEITALLWNTGSTVVAAAADGIYRSTNAGRAWRRVYEGEEMGIDAMAAVSEKTLLAVLETGGLLRSDNGGVQWSLDDNIEQDVHMLSVQVTAEQGVLAGTQDHGLLRSSDGGKSWEKVSDEIVLTLTCRNGICYAGSSYGMSMSDDGGRTWHDLPCPPLHDLRHLFIYKGQPLLTGTYAGIVRYTTDEWVPLIDIAQPLTSTAIAPDGSLLLSSAEGLVRASDDGKDLYTFIEGSTGHVQQITFRAKKTAWEGWAASVNEAQILHSTDSGATWQSLPTPFGVLPVVTLQAMSSRIVAATYDPRQYRVCLWSSKDDGKTWQRDAEAEVRWPVVATCPELEMVTIGNVFLRTHPSGRWNKVGSCNEDAMIRRVVSSQQNGKALLFTLTTSGIQRSEDEGASWKNDNVGLPTEQILDIAATDTDLYVLLTGGHVWKRVL